jgi:hypothetical protein
MSYANMSLKQRAAGETMRRDAWWTQPLFVFLGLSTFIVYSTWAAFQGTHYWVNQNGADYLSPFYSPEFFGSSPNAIFGAKPGWWPSWLLFSPALLVLWAPAGFRLTCYYYRGAYYKAFWADPLACTVGEPRKGYPGENSFPLIMQNIHRYFLYLALLFILVLAYDAWKAMWFSDSSGSKHFGIGLGTVVLTINVFLIGGFLDEVSKAPVCAKGYACVSCLNRRHMLCAWLSLFWVGFSDLYVRLCSMGFWHDWKIL